MGMFSYLCKGCNRPLVSHHDWMDETVALLPNGDRISGKYDGYGVVGSFELMDYYDTEYWHQACYDALGQPDFTSPSESAQCQGHFFDYPIHNVREPKTAEEVTKIWLDENHGHKLKRSNRTWVVVPSSLFSEELIGWYKRHFEGLEDYYEDQGLQAVPNFQVWERWEDEICGFSGLITQKLYVSSFRCRRDEDQPFFDEAVLNSGTEEELRKMLQEENERLYEAHTSFLDKSSVDEDTKARIRKTARENSDYTIEIATEPVDSLDPILPII